MARRYVQSEPNSNQGAGLETRHTHFVIVDGGAEGNWGDEIRLRDTVLGLLEKWYNVPSVCLVVQGGPNTLVTVDQAIESGTPVVLVQDSGGAADAIANFAAGWQPDSATSSYVDQLSSLQGGAWARPDQIEKLSNICKHAKDKGLLFPIKLVGPEAEGIDAAILRAIVRKQDSIKLKERENARQEREAARSSDGQPVTPHHRMARS